MEVTQQPKESWRKQLDTLLWQNIDLRPREESHARPMSIGLVNQLENFISQAIAEAIQEERKRIEEAVKVRCFLDVHVNVTKKRQRKIQRRSVEIMIGPIFLEMVSYVKTVEKSYDMKLSNK